MLGIASIIPFIEILTNPNYEITHPFLLSIINILDLTYLQSKVFVGSLIMFLFLSINMFTIYAIRKTVFYVAEIEHSISTDVMSYCLRRPYIEHINESPANLTKQILDDAGSLCSGVIYPLIQIYSKLLIISLISAFLIYVNYVIFLSSFFLISIIYVIIYKRFSNIVSTSGQKRLIINEKRYKVTRDVLDAAKEVKFYGLEKNYINKFSRHAEDFAYIDARINYLSSIPRYIIEIFIFLILFIMILYLVSTNNPLVTYLPTIGVFVIAAYRAIPMIQNIYINLNLYKLYSPVFNIIENIYIKNKLLENDKKYTDKRLSLKKEIRFEDVFFEHTAGKPILNKVSFSITAKNVTVIFGKTGLGKTTIIDLLLGFYKPKAGLIKVDDKIIDYTNQNSFNRNIGYVPQNINLQQDTLLNNITLGSNSKPNIQLVDKILDIVDLSDLVKNLNDGINTNIGDRGVKLSGGQRQRVGIARALYLEPEILVFDESTNELDIRTEEKVLKSLRQQYPAMTIIMITHRLSSIKLSDDVLMLEKNIVKKIKSDQINEQDLLASTQ